MFKGTGRCALCEVRAASVHCLSCTANGTSYEQLRKCAHAGLLWDCWYWNGGAAIEVVAET